MKRIGFAFGIVVFATFFATASIAQSTRTFVSGQGKDKAACTQTAPCRTFTQAISQTSAGGVVVAVDSASYTSFTITKAVTVEAPVGAAITVTSGDGIDINAGVTDVVILRGLTVNNQGGSGNGIVFNSGATVHIERCVANGFSGFGMSGIAILGSGSVFLKDTIARDNYNGLSLEVGTTGTATTSVAMDQLHLDSNRIGLSLQTGADGLVNAAIRSSSASGNSDVGLLVNANAGGNISLDIESCLVTNSSIGLVAESSSSGSVAASISLSSVTHNTVNGYNIAGESTVNSRGNNTFIGNGPNTGSLTLLAGQ
jgi:hypothetical protein